MLFEFYRIIAVIGAMQAENPKQQYLLLKALNEVITSLGLPPANTQLPAVHQDQVHSPLCMKETLFGAVLCCCARPSCKQAV